MEWALDPISMEPEFQLALGTLARCKASLQQCGCGATGNALLKSCATKIGYASSKARGEGKTANIIQNAFARGQWDDNGFSCPNLPASISHASSLGFLGNWANVFLKLRKRSFNVRKRV